jgi:hypothetical protein
MPLFDVRATGRLNLSNQVGPFGLLVSAFISMPFGPLAGFCMVAGAVVVAGTQFDVVPVVVWVVVVPVVPVVLWVVVVPDGVVVIVVLGAGGAPGFVCVPVVEVVVVDEEAGIVL